jgi:AcrR family transcriptional regulator
MVVKRDAGDEQMKEKQTAGKVALKILEAARGVFAERGYSGARMDEIAGRAGVNKATLYYQIGDKDTLYAGVIHQVLGDVASKIAAAVEGAGHPRDKLAADIEVIDAAVEDNPELPPILLREVASDGAHLPHVVIGDIARVVTILAGILEEGKKKGFFADVNPFLIHCMIMGTILIYKKAATIKDRQKLLPAGMKRFDKKLNGTAGQAVALLVLGALKKQRGGID